jgi:hypothetical protein
LSNQNRSATGTPIAQSFTSASQNPFLRK